MPALQPAPLTNVTVTPTTWRVDAFPTDHPAARHHVVYIATHGAGYAVINGPNADPMEYADRDGKWCYARRYLDGDDYVTWPERHIFDWPTALAVAKAAVIGTFEDTEHYILAETLRVAPMLPLDLTTDGGTALHAVRAAMATAKANAETKSDRELFVGLMLDLHKIVGQ